MKRNAIWGMAGILLILSGCTTGPIDVGLSQSRLDSPESYGTFGAGRVDFGSRSTHKATLTPDYGLTLATQTPTQLNSVADDGAGIGFGILDRVDIDYKMLSGSPNLWQLKFQVLGENRRDSKPGNFSLAVTGGYGHELDKGTGEVSPSLLFIPLGTLTASYSLQYTVYDVGLILGYRCTPAGELYGGFSRTWMNYSGDQSPFTGGDFLFSGKGQQSLAHLGMIFSPVIKPPPEGQDPKFFEYAEPFVQVEGSLSWATIDGVSQFSPNGSVNFGVEW